jgi:hypothetical protein
MAWNPDSVLGLKQADAKPRISSMPYPYDIAEGNVSGHSRWLKCGYNPDVSTSEEAVYGVSAAYTWPASAQQMEVVSASANDAAAGTGVRTVRIYYLDGSGVEKTTDVTLNGLTAVSTTATDIYRVQSFRAMTVGTGGVAAGNIDLRHLSDTPIYSRILTGYTQGRAAIYQVPAGKTLYITDLTFAVVSTSGSRTARVTLRTDYDDFTGAIGSVFRLLAEVALVDQAHSFSPAVPIKVPAGARLICVATASASVQVYCRFAGWIE